MKIRDLIRSVTNISDDYNGIYMRTKFDTDDKLLLNKIKIPTIAIVFITGFHENDKYYPHAFLDKCLCEI